MQSCLEKLSIEQRHKELVRSDYTQYDQYSYNHEDARGGSGQHGKGTGNPGGAKWSVPHCGSRIGEFDYSNWDTHNFERAGNCQDIEARRIAMARSLFNMDYTYSLKNIDRSANINEGQYVGRPIRLSKAEREHCAMTMPGIAR